MLHDSPRCFHCGKEKLRNVDAILFAGGADGEHGDALEAPGAVQDRAVDGLEHLHGGEQVSALVEAARVEDEEAVEDEGVG